MNGKFKCCGKDFRNLTCVVCHNVFHPSCNKNVFKLEQHKIICSTDCQTFKEHDEMKSQTLTDELSKLQTLLEEKESYLGRLKRSSQNFEVSVIEAETELLERIDNQLKLIDELNTKITTLKKGIENLLQGTKDKQEAIIKLENDLTELNEINRNMIASIESRNENKVNTEEGYVCKTKMVEQEAYTTTLNSQLRKLHIEHERVVEMNQNLKKELEKIKVENAKFYDSMTTLLDENKENKTALEELKLTQSDILMKVPSNVKHAR
ncbi:hypothetical protein JTB14_018051 [Gonioctena quinquepunctata]|nr:hypothetical protein JTB14_018051 [Gonioctena quinquepunctata]